MEWAKSPSSAQLVAFGKVHYCPWPSVPEIPIPPACSGANRLPREPRLVAKPPSAEQGRRRGGSQAVMSEDPQLQCRRSMCAIVEVDLPRGRTASRTAPTGQTRRPPLSAGQTPRVCAQRTTVDHARYQIRRSVPRGAHGARGQGWQAARDAVGRLRPVDQTAASKCV